MNYLELARAGLWKPAQATVAGLVLMGLTPLAWSQATSRPCTAASDQPGPACLLSHQAIGMLSTDVVYWRLYTYPSVAAAEQDRPEQATVIEAFGKAWLFTIGAKDALMLTGQHVADVGPIEVARDTSYDAEFLKSTFSVGMKAPVHVHSGPEAFYAISGGTCLETPDGVQLGRGAGNSLVVRRGPPMLLMAIGPEARKGFALILHDRSQRPTTLVHDWTPRGLCQAEVR